MIELNKIYQGDCIELLQKVPNNSVDCIITDPPYGIKYHSGYYKNGNPHREITNDDTLFIPLNELWKILKPTGCMFVFYSHKVPLVDKRVKNVIIWVKNNWTAGDLYGDFGNQYECIAFMPKKDFKLKFKRYTNIMQFDRVSPNKLKHPTQKPLNLIRTLIQASTKKGDIILDPFAGSGTTLVASKQMNRKFIGMELERDYIRIINERLNQKTLMSVFS